MYHFCEPCATLGHPICPEILVFPEHLVNDEGSYLSDSLTKFGHGAFVNLTTNITL